ncbi:hypothetical protein C6501_14285, partial [Candidatus Poribacteria bacterium]
LIAYILSTLIFAGCGTDIKPNYFINMLADDRDIDRLSECLIETSQIDEDGNMVIKLNVPCISKISEGNSLPDTIVSDASFEEILRNPIAHMGKMLTFEAYVKKLHHHTKEPELYTGRNNLRFLIASHGVPVLIENEEGDEVYLTPDHKYIFTCRIYEIKTHEDWGNVSNIYASFVIRSSKKADTLVHPPIPVAEE